jgi:hypothetical protein
VSDSIEGLMMAGRCISVDGNIYGLTRIMGTCMGTGEASGTAAALAVEKGIPPKELDINLLRDTLIKNGVIL